MFKRTTAINKILKLKKFVKGIQGGTSAGKTYGIIPILIDKAIKTPGLEISVVAETMPHIRRGARRDFIKIMNSTKRWNRQRWNATESIYTFTNGSIIEFFSADDESKLKGARRDILYMNEANNMSFNVYTQLASRTKLEVFMDWNPTNEFWFHEELVNDDDVDFLILTYVDNEACPESALKFILKAKEKGFIDPEAKDLFNTANIKSKYWANWHRVYGLGLAGRLEGVIFENVQNYTDLPGANLYKIYAIDWGGNDPTTLIELNIDDDNKRLYIKEHVYQPQILNSKLIKKIYEINQDDHFVICDSARKDKIYELQMAGIQAYGSTKGEGSVLDGIERLQEFTIFVHVDSINTRKEFDTYAWAKDKEGKTLNVPEDKNNHSIDPSRYALRFYKKSINP